MRIVFLLSLAICLGAEPLVQRTQVMMGTIVTLSVTPDKASIVQKAFNRLKAVEHALSSYAPDADIYRINHEKNVSIRPDTYEALLLCRRYYRESGGYFNPAIGAITHKAFHFGEQERIPPVRELERADLNFNSLHYDVHFASIPKGITLDLGGMGKGFGVDKVAQLFFEHNVTAGRIALSGDIRCIDRCTIAIDNPFKPDTVVATFKSRAPGLAVSTSGNYRHYVHDTTHNHLIDPYTRNSERHFASITLLAYGSNADLDAYATAAAVMPPRKALKFLNERGAGYLIYTVDKKRIVSENIDRFVKDLHLY